MSAKKFNGPPAPFSIAMMLSKNFSFLLFKKTGHLLKTNVVFEIKKNYLIGFAVVLMLFSGTGSLAQCTPPNININSVPTVVGTAGAVGAKYRRTNVIPGVDIEMQIVSLNNGATLVTEDDAVGTPPANPASGYYEPWQPVVRPNGATGDVGITWKVSFFVNGSGFVTPYRFNCLSILALDVDGDGANIKEYVEATNPYSYGGQSATNFLTYSQTATTLRAQATTNAVITNIDSTQRQAEVQFNFVNISSFTYTTGANKTTATSTDRQYSLLFRGTPNFTTPFKRYFNTDNDGSNSINESNDADDDNDGIPDVAEYPAAYPDPFADADGDGLPNYMDPTPGGAVPAFADANGDGISDKYDIDMDGLVNSIDLDSDNDGIPDLVEAGGIDTNGDGIVDNLTDADNDGLADIYDTTQGGVNIRNSDTDGDGIPNARDLDSDNDGIPDVVEAGFTDVNNDGKIDANTDVDGDGLADVIDGDVGNDGAIENTSVAILITSAVGGTAGQPASYPRANADANGLPNGYDLDSDGDGILDSREAGITQDTNNDGVVKAGDTGYTDSNGDGWSDQVDALASLTPTNTDGDAKPDYQDIDSDNDGIADIIEGQTTAAYTAPGGTDTDGDGIDNAYDNNTAAFGGNANNGLTPVNTDGTDNVDYRDLDSDNDGKPDRLEGWDTNGNAVIDGAEKVYVGATDTDGDGLLDEYDVINGVATANNVTNGNTPSSFPDINNPGGDRDWRQFATCTSSLTNTSFELPVLSGNGNHIFGAGVPIAGWRVGGNAAFNMIIPGGSYNGGPDNAQSGTQYMDIASSAGIFTQIFDLTCPSSLTFSGYFSSRESSGSYINWTAKIEILTISGTVVATSSTRNFTNADGDGGTDAVWYLLGGASSGNLPAGRYIYKVTMGDYGNFDNAGLCVSGCYKYPDTDGDLIGNVNDIDSDNDGIPDLIENGGFDAYGDVDNDGIPNYTDTTPGAGVPAFVDANGDGINDAYDYDKDGIINSEDLDSDNDGIPDIVEAGGIDTNGDGRVDGVFTDTDGDGLSNIYDTDNGGVNIANLDTDGDGIANFKDLDSDGDGIPDVVEAGGTDANNDGKLDGFTDTDNDGLADIVDGDVGNDGTPENTAGALIITSAVGGTPGRPASYPRANADGNGLPNPYDLDSDGDGITDATESNLGFDTNGDGVIKTGDTGFTDSNGDGWSDQIAAFTSLPLLNTDNAGNPNYLDIDSDNDGIPDNIEAQTTAAYTAPSGTDTDGDGIDNAYDNVTGTYGGNANNGVQATDTDGDRVPDYQDIDSDNDGKSDALEGWDTNGNGKIDGAEKSFSAADADGDGLSDGYDAVSGVTTANNVTNNTTPVSYPDINNPGGNRDWRQALDTDKDGIPDTTDADDDNDGIPDIVECPVNNTKVFQNGWFELPVIAATSFQITTTVPGWNTTASDNSQEIWSTGYNGVPSAQGNQFAEINANQVATLYQNFSLNGTGATVYWSVKHRGRLGVDVATVKFANSLAAITGAPVTTTMTDGTGAWGTYSGSFSVAFGVTDLYFALNSVSSTGGASVGNFIDDVQIMIVNQPCDNDGDGIPNSLDLDSDNDGIPDIVEAGGIDTDGNGTADGFADSDGDGLANTYDASTGGVNIANLDTDGDGIANSQDLDSDGDGIPDVVEAGGTDANNDGKLDGFTDTDNDGLADIVDGDVGNDGTSENTAGALIITSAVGGTPGRPASYPRANQDGTGLPNPYDLDSDGDGILDSREAGITQDTNNDGVVNSSDAGFTDTNADGWSDQVDALASLTPTNTDGDVKPDYLDIDADNDGIPDNIEAQTTAGYIAPSGTDTDGDGIDNAYDNNTSVYGGNANNGLTPVNTDGTDNVDYLDADSDNDGKPDRLEGWDTNGNGIIDGAEKAYVGTTDTDGDGLLNEYDAISGVTTANNVTNGTTPASYPDVNNPGGDRDWRQANDKDKDGVADVTDLDDDNDGIPDLVENGGFNPFGDTDADGIPNYLDATPGAGQPAFTDANGDGINDYYDTDKDGVLNSFDLDSDNDGIPDIVEAGGIDTDGNGTADGFADSDGDGLANTYDASTGGVNIANLDTDGDGIANSQDIDSDGDGIPDVVEAGGTDANNDGKLDGFTDTDNDGLADTVDGDVGNDGTSENTAGALIITSAVGGTPGRPASYPRANQDGTGLPNPYDLDSDGDGILDVREAGFTDTNNDGIADGTLGSDGWSDTIDALATLNLTNTDGRGKPNYLDIDSDDDGVVDNIEGQTTAGYIAPTGTDSDGDGIDNAYDNNNAAFGGNANNGVTPTNSDGIDLPDYLDLDSDNDGYPDSFEGHDTNGDNLPDVGSPANNGVSGGLTDADGDGLLDGYDNNTASPDPTNGTIPNNYPNIDGGTSERDWREVANTDNTGGGNTTDIDDDNDGTPDIAECGGFDPLGDADGDGIRNYLDPTPGAGLPAFSDVNGDGINDFYDTDKDGIINSLDLDSDNDGIPDLVEAGGIDTNGDGRVDNITDTDGDGLSDTYDTSTGGVNIANLDTDGDGIVNSQDTDSDGDGIPDVVEAGGTDANNDGKIDTGTDTDGDGLADIADGDVGNDGVAENTAGALIITGPVGGIPGRPGSYPRANADASGLPNPYDLDSDGDGILDVREAALPDADNNGIADGTLGADGWSDTIDALPSLGIPNSDSDNKPNYLDIDADNDGLSDNVEGQTTAAYTSPSGTDSDGDGIDNTYDNNNALYAGGANNGITPNNNDGTDQPDYLDTDSDNDAKSDAIEGNDWNSNAMPDENTALTGIDTDGDGLDDVFDLVNGPNVTIVGFGGTGSKSTAQKTIPGATDRDWRNSLYVLPVTLISFNAEASNGVAYIRWAAENEINFSSYVVERSTDGVHFTAIGYQTPQSGSNRHNYQLADNLQLVNADIIYYRLKMVDIDGRFGYSPIAKVVKNGSIAKAIKIITNPGAENVQLKITSDMSAKTNIKIMTSLGQVLYQTNIQVFKGDNIFPVQKVGFKLSSGAYFITVNINGDILTTRFIF